MVVSPSSVTSSATPFISARVLSSLSGLATPAMAQLGSSVEVVGVKT